MAQAWHAVIALFTGSQQASAAIPVRDAGPVTTPDSTTTVGPQLIGSSPAR
jgi:hypothetical protein